MDVLNRTKLPVCVWLCPKEVEQSLIQYFFWTTKHTHTIERVYQTEMGKCGKFRPVERQWRTPRVNAGHKSEHN